MKLPFGFMLVKRDPERPDRRIEVTVRGEATSISPGLRDALVESFRHDLIRDARKGRPTL